MPPRTIVPLVVAIAIAIASPAAAQPDARRDAARAFSEGTRAFDAGDYTRAAESYETAYTLAPHEDALWNAARAWHRAGELARAANAYASYLRAAPPTARDRGGATVALKALAAKLGRIEVNVSEGVTDVRVDGKPLAGPSVYVVPGTHVLRASGPRGPIEQQQGVNEGETTSVVLAASAEAPAVPQAVPTPDPPAAAEPRTRDAASEEPRRGWSPLVVWIGGGLALAMGGLAVWSGSDTLKELHAFDAGPTQERLDSGKSKQLRTNLLITASAGVAVLTGLAAIFLVDWRGRGTKIALGIAPAFATATGSF
jgi:hypothetical protein